MPSSRKDKAEPMRNNHVYWFDKGFTDMLTDEVLEKAFENNI